MFDIIFLSYNESNADSNWNILRERFPYAKRLHGVNGIHSAHQTAAKLAFSKMFWVVDGDTEITDDFNFDEPSGVWDQSVYVYRSCNPINGLAYGNGGIKLLPRYYALKIDENTVDMTTSLAPHFTAVDKIAGITRFNTTPFDTWRSAFRECVKLSSKVIDRQLDTETERRLEAWCTIGADKPYGEFALSGAKQGKEYGQRFANDASLLRMINNFSWLEDYFKQRYSSNGS